jgi:hypothetical protein
MSSNKQIVTRVEVKRLPKSNPKKNSKKRNRKRNQRRQQVAQGNYGPRLANCTYDYATALVNPFKSFARELCIPDTIVIPSFKFRTFTRGVFSTGVLGVGFAIYNPFLANMFQTGPTGTLTNDPVIYTTTAYPNAYYAWSITAGAYSTGIAGAGSNSPFTPGFWQIGLVAGDSRSRQYRLVAAGIRVRYIGTDFRNQGRLILYRSEGNQTVYNASTVLTGSNLLASTYAQSVPVSRKSSYVFYQPDQATLLNYQSVNVYDPTLGGGPAIGNANWSLLIYVDGGDTTTPQSWEFEACSWYEAVGSQLSVTMSHSDPVGFGAVNAAGMARNPTTSPEQVEKPFLRKVLDNILTSTSQVILESSKQIPRMAMNYMQMQNSRNQFMVEDID